MDVIFSNKRYGCKVLVCVILLFLACYYSCQRGKKEVFLEDCYKDPVKSHNSILTFYGGTVIEEGYGFFLYQYEGKVLKVYGKLEAKKGELVDILVRFHRDSTLYFMKERISTLFMPMSKEVISIIALGIIVWKMREKYRFVFFKGFILRRGD